MATCPYKDPCYMREKNLYGHNICTALSDTWFADGRCHFRKETPGGKNKYDEWRRDHGKHSH